MRTRDWFWLTFIVLVFGSLGTHIVHCIRTEQWGLLIAGAIMPPIGMIHGIGVWFGAW